MNPLRFSIIVPIYNRPVEVKELLESLTKQTDDQFEVVIVEDGSSVDCKVEVEQQKDALDVNYFFKPNSGPGQSRNYGFERAQGNYCIFLDSDCIVPPYYIETVRRELTRNYVDAFGGPDRAHESFSPLQKAINYSMTSFFTTGGIRGGGEKMDKFYPRSFNMGYSREVFETTGGFGKMRFGEDIDMSNRIIGHQFSTGLIKEAFVYHKRRTNFRQFFKQVYNSGIARINLHKRHPGTLKLVHTLPALFTFFLFLALIVSVFGSPLFILPWAVHMLIIGVDAGLQTKSLKIAGLAIVASYVQLIGYGLGFMEAFWKRIVLRKAEFEAFKHNFYD